MQVLGIKIVQILAWISLSRLTFNFQKKMALLLGHLLVIACVAFETQAVYATNIENDPRLKDMLNLDTESLSADVLDDFKLLSETDLRKDMTVDISSHPYRDVAIYAGMGYNALDANPESDYIAGGQDPGFRVTTMIFTHTYDLGSTVPYLDGEVEEPDQVEMKFANDCFEENKTVAYNGQKSYKQELELSTEVEGMFSAVRFNVERLS